MKALRTATDPDESVETSSFAEFYRSEYASVAGFAYVLTGDHAAAEDLAQEAFLAARQAWQKVARYDQPGAWVRHVLVNRSRTRFRRLTRERRALARLGPVDEGSPPPGLRADAVDVWREVRKLPRRQAQVIALTYLGGLTLEEIGNVLECSPLTAKTHLQRGKRTLARTLGTEGGFGT
jgi:RNA polymerase sigma factor (sigma-70 family)